MHNEQIEDFVNLYFQAERRANVIASGQRTFLVTDRAKLAEKFQAIFKDFGIRRYPMACMLADHENPNFSSVDRHAAVSKHNYRLKVWTAEYELGALKLENAIAVKREAKVQTEEITKLKKNLVDSAVAICTSALKFNISEEGIKLIFSSALITAKENQKIREVKGALEAFMREKGINKDIALQILDAIS